MRIDAGLNVVSDFSPAPEAVYELAVKRTPEVEPQAGQTNDLGKPVVKVVIYSTIDNGEFAGKEVRRQLTNASAGTRYFQKQFLTGIGVPIAEDGSFDTDDISGRRFKALVKIRDYETKEGEKRKANEIDAETCVPQA